MEKKPEDFQIYENEKIFINKQYMECKTILREISNDLNNEEKSENKAFQIYVCGRRPDISKFYEENKNNSNDSNNYPIISDNLILFKNRNNNYNIKENMNNDNNDNFNTNSNDGNEDNNSNRSRNNNNDGPTTRNNDKVIYLDDSEEEEENNSEDNKKENMDNNTNSNGNNFNNINFEQLNNINNINDNNSNFPPIKYNNQLSNDIGNNNMNNNNTGLGDNNQQSINNLSINNENGNYYNNQINYNDNQSYKTDKKLFYKRTLSSNRKCRYKGKDRINLQICIGIYNSNQDLPPFIFARNRFYYTPHNVRQFVSNTAYIISFPGLLKTYHNKIVKYDLKHVCTYYFKKKRGKQTSMDIKVKDEKSLNDGVFLNDGIINFYLKIIEDEYTYNEENNNNVLIMKSYFYNILSNQQNQDLSNNFNYPDSASYIGTKINVFDFKTLIIPICENYHWSLIIVNDIDKMKSIFDSLLEDDQFNMNNYGGNSPDSGSNMGNEDSFEYPEIFYLDSFFDMNQRRMVIILKYLFYEYQKIYKVNCNIPEFLLKNFQKIQCYIPDVPKQDNSFDCGIFLLMYAELFLFDPLYFLKNASKKKKYANLNTKNENEFSKYKFTNDISNINNINNINNVNSNNYNNIENYVSNNITTNYNEVNMNINNDINNNIISNNVVNYIMNYNINSNNNLNTNIQINNNIFINNITQYNPNENINNINNIQNNIPNNIPNNIQNNIPNNIPNNNEKDNTINTTNFNNTQDMINSNEQPMNDRMNMDNANYEQRNDANSMNYNGVDQFDERTLRYWFNTDLISNFRDKIKKLISELSKIEKEVNKNDFEAIIRIQNAVIKKYMDEQKREFTEYFSKIEQYL